MYQIIDRREYIMNIWVYHIIYLHGNILCIWIYSCVVHTYLVHLVFKCHHGMQHGHTQTNMFDIVWPYFTLQQPPLPLWAQAHRGKFHFPKDGQMIYWGRALSIRCVSYVAANGSIHKPIFCPILALARQTKKLGDLRMIKELRGILRFYE